MRPADRPGCDVAGADVRPCVGWVDRGELCPTRPGPSSHPPRPAEFHLCVPALSVSPLRPSQVSAAPSPPLKCADPGSLHPALNSDRAAETVRGFSSPGNRGALQISRVRSMPRPALSGGVMANAKKKLFHPFLSTVAPKARRRRGGGPRSRAESGDWRSPKRQTAASPNEGQNGRRPIRADHLVPMVARTPCSTSSHLDAR